MNGRPRIVRSTYGARLVQADATLSRVSDRPGPTHGLFDVLAATVQVLSPGPRFLMLGFAAGGMVAPLRGLGWEAPIEAVDRSRVGVGLFRELCGGWAGDVRVHQGDAVDFLKRTRRRWDLVLDDMSVLGTEGVTKPLVSFGEVPRRSAARMGTGGVFVANLLPHPRVRMTAAIDRISEPFPAALLILAEGYDNRLLVAGRELPAAAALSRRIRGELRRLGARLAPEISIRTLC